MARYRVLPWIFTHQSNEHNPETWREAGVMLNTKAHAFFISKDHAYDVANAIVDTLETMEGENG